MSDWVFDGGRPCLDLVNTFRDRALGGRELLTGPAALADWFVAAGLLTTRPRVTAAQLAAALDLRTAVDDVLLGHRPSVAGVRLVNQVAQAVPLPVPQLRSNEGGRLRVVAARKDVPSVLTLLAVDAIELAATETTVRECAADDCGLRFADTSPKGNRQWCSMARCGNRMKARAHYARRQQPR
ncbi:CGNR zinc finger domain-containing protein [Actinocrispum wychmicini]|uniref:Putative RNA-binding Zn ribbon-like protein n=1 Tax=Actinocrispum wychmicini TaxID=1213861 RepID=A0A4R2JJ17_9PSEU|nr:CGNR zinc finger domain-containing protein [Actinocrispum wychmicini]TCO59901.1 putative RNA-binding Zn ribbon-like protein [Actinocrispum wychmicini]